MLKGDFLAEGTEEEYEGSFVVNHDKVAHKILDWMQEHGLLKRESYLLIHGYDTNKAIKNQGLYWLENFTSQEPDDYKKVEELATRASLGENYDDILHYVYATRFYKPLIERTAELVDNYKIKNQRPSHISFEKDILRLSDGMTIDDLPASIMGDILDLRIRFNNIQIQA